MSFKHFNVPKISLLHSEHHSIYLYPRYPSRCSTHLPACLEVPAMTHNAYNLESICVPNVRTLRKKSSSKSAYHQVYFWLRQTIHNDRGCWRRRRRPDIQHKIESALHNKIVNKHSDKSYSSAQVSYYEPLVKLHLHCNCLHRNGHARHRICN